MLIEAGYVAPSGRMWDIHCIPNRYMGDLEAAWVACSCDASGDAMEADTKADLLAKLECPNE